jgi:hypothetical protein
VGELELVGTGKASLIEFSDPLRSKRGKKRVRRPDTQIEEWTAHDFAFLALEEYKNRIGRGWDLNWVAVCIGIFEVRDGLADIYGFCDNLMLYDYMRFFFVNYFANFAGANGAFYISHMCREKVRSAFYESYNYRTSTKLHRAKVRSVTKEEGEVKVETAELTSEAIESSFLISDEMLVSDYGILIPVNWLVARQDMAVTSASRYVFQSCLKLYKKGRFPVVKTVTEKWNPYPEWLPYKKALSLTRKVDASLVVEVMFSNIEDSKFEFLRS